LTSLVDPRFTRCRVWLSWPPRCDSGDAGPVADAARTGTLVARLLVAADRRAHVGLGAGLGARQSALAVPRLRPLHRARLSGPHLLRRHAAVANLPVLRAERRSDLTKN